MWLALAASVCRSRYLYRVVVSIGIGIEAGLRGPSPDKIPVLRFYLCSAFTGRALQRDDFSCIYCSEGRHFVLWLVEVFWTGVGDARESELSGKIVETYDSMRSVL
jgi:hypothetical protein